MFGRILVWILIQALAALAQESQIGKDLGKRKDHVTVLTVHRGGHAGDVCSGILGWVDPERKV